MWKRITNVYQDGKHAAMVEAEIRELDLLNAHEEEMNSVYVDVENLSKEQERLYTANKKQADYIEHLEAQLNKEKEEKRLQQIKKDRLVYEQSLAERGEPIMVDIQDYLFHDDQQVWYTIGK